MERVGCADAARLGRFVKDRREELGLRQDELGRRGGPSTTTLTKVENAVTPQLAAVTLLRLDMGLGWEPGSSARVLAGGHPSVVSGESVADREVAPAGVETLLEASLHLLRSGRGDLARPLLVQAIRELAETGVAARADETPPTPGSAEPSDSKLEAEYED
ncbi:helix-turn-helix domain-containing protein [Gordonia sihwensis]|uniref:helix-turn-helix domain-containing protein n=1 Tax=Gordonia sihwensis TaxID=173559 RepID=UPI003D9763A9